MLPVRQSFPAKPHLPTTREEFCRPPETGIYVSKAILSVLSGLCSLKERELNVGFYVNQVEVLGK